MNDPDAIKRPIVMKRPFFFFAVILALLILTFRVFVKEDDFYPGHISHFVSEDPRHLAVKGRIATDPFYKHTYYKEGQNFILRPGLVKVSETWSPVYGDIRVTSYHAKGLKYGDKILFEARLKAPSGSSGYRRYLARSGIYAVAVISEKDPVIITGKEASPIKRYAYGLKKSIKNKIESIFHAPERYFLCAILLGERQDMPAEWKEFFTKTQTMHLLAISGLHVGLIAFIILALLGFLRIPRDPRFIITILFMIFYAIMVGGRPSVIRATVMAVVILSSYVVKRDADIYNSLGLAAAAILLFNPEELFNLGFILSFMSVLSIVYLTPRLNELFRLDRINRDAFWGKMLYYFSNLGSVSMAVWLGLLPLTANFFNIISPISIIVNILAIPLLFVIIALSISAFIFQPILNSLGELLGVAAELFIAILFSLLKYASELPFAYFELKTGNIPAVFVYYVVMMIIFRYKGIRQIR